jgi:hypothetical protein
MESVVKLKPILNASVQNSCVGWEIIYLQQQKRCFYCGEFLSRQERTRDHLFPRSHGFKLTGNMVFAHELCNLKKGIRYPTYSEIIQMWFLYKDIKRKKPGNYMILALRNGKPRFKLVITKELIDAYTN